VLEQLLREDAGAVSCRVFVTFLEQAARLADDDLFGLDAGLAYDLRESGLAGYAAIAASTVRAAMQSAVRFGAMRDNSAVYALDEAGLAATFRIESLSAHMRASRHATEFKAGLVLAACHRWIGPGFRPVEMHFAHQRAASLRAVERRFNCPVRFGTEATEMLLGTEQLDLPVRGADPYLHALISGHAEAALTACADQQRRGDVRSRVERVVVEALPRGVPTLAGVAGKLGIGERTLARRLAAEGARFRDLVDELRRDMAKNYLADPELSLAQIAYLLGYAEQSAFTSAFRRWTGKPPRRFRSASREG